MNHIRHISGLSACAVLILLGPPLNAQEEIAAAGTPRWSTEQDEVHVSYTIDCTEREEHLVEVTVRLSDLRRSSVHLLIPTDPDPRALDRAGRRIIALAAAGEEGFAVPFRQVALGRWEFDTRDVGELVVSYTVYANDPSPWSVQLTARHAYLHPAALLLYAPEFADRPISLRLILPDGWQTAASLTPSFDPAHFQADSFAQLTISPIFAGRFQESFFTAGGMNVRVVIDGATSTFDSRTFLLGLERLVNRAVGIFDTIPAEDYLFIVHFSDARQRARAGFCATTTLFWDQHAREDSLDPLLREGTAAFMRSWLGGRIRPRGAGDSLIEPMVVESLWFLEGAAAYYADLLLTRSGFVPGDAFLARIGEQIMTLQNTPARLHQSAIRASEEVRYRAWAEQRRPERSLDPATKGYLLCFLLDLRMRDATENHRSLDDLMAFLTAWFGRGGTEYSDSAEILRAAGALAGVDLSDFYTRFVAGTEELPYEEILAAAGWDLRRTAVEVAAPGFGTEPEGTGALIVTAVEEHAPAARAGLRVGDRIVVANGRPVTELGAVLEAARPGENLSLRIQRRMTEETISFELGRGNRQGYVIEAVPDPDPRQRAIATGLLSGIP